MRRILFATAASALAALTAGCGYSQRTQYAYAPPGGTYYGDRIFGAIATGLRSSSWVPALVALGFATGFIHYLLDRSIYRMSDPKVRTAARGLLNQG